MISKGSGIMMRLHQCEFQKTLRENSEHSFYPNDTSTDMQLVSVEKV